MVEEFVVVDGPLTYDTILKRPTIHNLWAIPSTYHQVMKFPTPLGMGYVVGQQRASRECYTIALKEPKLVCAINVETNEHSSSTLVT